VAGLAAVDDVGLGTLICTIADPIRSRVFSNRRSAAAQADQVAGDVFIHLCLGGGHGLQHLAEFEAFAGALIADLVVGFLELGEVELLPAASGNSTSPTCFCTRQFLLLAGF